MPLNRSVEIQCVLNLPQLSFVNRRAFFNMLIRVPSIIFQEVFQ
jgi:hypothetical protein